MTDNYINLKKEKETLKATKDNYFFGICFGSILILISFCKLIFSINTTKYDIFYILLMVFGALIIITAIIYPNLLSILKKFLSKIFNFIGTIIFDIILTIIYFLLVCPFGIFIKKKQENNSISNSTFVDYKYDSSIININKHSFIYQISKLFKFFFNEKYIMLIPVLIILIIIAVLLIFVQSSAIAPFIYTIF